MISTLCIFCDDVRAEVSGKLTLVGVYVGEIRFPSLPAVLPRINLLIYVTASLSDRWENGLVSISVPNGRVYESAFSRNLSNVVLEQASHDPELATFFQVVYVTLPDVEFVSQGRLKVDVEIDGEAMRAGSLKVRDLSSNL